MVLRQLAGSPNICESREPIRINTYIYTCVKWQIFSNISQNKWMYIFLNSRMTSSFVKDYKFAGSEEVSFRCSTWVLCAKKTYSQQSSNFFFLSLSFSLSLICSACLCFLFVDQVAEHKSYSRSRFFFFVNVYLWTCRLSSISFYYVLLARLRFSISSAILRPTSSYYLNLLFETPLFYSMQITVAATLL